MNCYPRPPHKLSAHRWKNMKIGILGGSFNPPHKGHMHIALTALRQKKMDYIWWMVSPQNPLKQRHTNFNKRYNMTKKFVRHPKMIVTDIENVIGAQYSYQTIKALKKYFPKSQFTWIAGMDNALIFHRWDHWRLILKSVPFIFFNRPPNRMAVKNNIVRLYQGRKNVKWELRGKTRNISSTSLRRKNKAIALFSRNTL